jgi:hypothetical protein
MTFNIEIMNNFSPESKIWIYQSSREFTNNEAAEINAFGKSFAESWASHGNRLSAHFEIRYNRFLIFAVDEKAAGASGCSIDKSVAFVKQLETKYNVNFFDRMLTAFKSNGEIVSLPLSEFQDKVKAGEITGQTIVFNNLVSTKEDFETTWETELKNTWLARFI